MKRIKRGHRDEGRGHTAWPHSRRATRPLCWILLSFVPLRRRVFQRAQADFVVSSARWSRPSESCKQAQSLRDQDCAWCSEDYAQRSFLAHPFVRGEAPRVTRKGVSQMYNNNTKPRALKTLLSCSPALKFSTNIFLSSSVSQTFTSPSFFTTSS